jgi:hypothetical protein
MLQGEGGEVERKGPVLSFINTIDTYYANNVYNMDEIGFFYGSFHVERLIAR